VPAESNRERRSQPPVQHERKGAQETPQQRNFHRHTALLHFPSATPAKTITRQTREISPLAQGAGNSGEEIHIVGSPELKIEGTPVYLDVEGLPDAISITLSACALATANLPSAQPVGRHIEDEEKIWREFTGILETIRKPVLIHYGNYEKTFLNIMCERHGKPPEDAVGAGFWVQASICSRTSSRKFTFRLFEWTQRYGGRVGFQVAEVGSSGLNAIAWRCQWEEMRDTLLKDGSPHTTPKIARH